MTSFEKIMTQKDKELLLTDLFARLPYGVKVNAPFTSNKNENAKGYKINGINFRVVEWTPVLFGEKKQRNSIIIEAFSEKYNQYCSIDIELNNDIERVRPYLFPLSSMTEEQFNELKSYVDLNYEHNTLELVEWDNNYKTLEFWLEEIPSYCVIKVFDWLNKNHFDYRGLIPMGLAIDATDKNIY